MSSPRTHSKPSRTTSWYGYTLRGALAGPSARRLLRELTAAEISHTELEKLYLETMRA